MTKYYIGYFTYQKYRQYKSGKKKGQDRPLDFINDQYTCAILIKDGDSFSKYTTTTETTIKNEVISITRNAINFKEKHIIKDVGNTEEFFNHRLLKPDEYGYYELSGTPDIMNKEFEKDSEAIDWFKEITRGTYAS